MTTHNHHPAAKWPTVKVTAYDLVPDEVVVDATGRRTVAAVRRESVNKRLRLRGHLAGTRHACDLVHP